MAWKLFVTVVALCLVAGCSGPAVIIHDHFKHQTFDSVPLKEVVIYRSQKPVWSHKSIGTIEVNGMNDIEGLYAFVREKAAEKGAQGVIDFELDSEEVVTTSETTTCTPEGVCTKISVLTNNMVYTATGTLVVHNEEI